LQPEQQPQPGPVQFAQQLQPPCGCVVGVMMTSRSVVDTHGNAVAGNATTASRVAG
jgi:hypothetical protein